MSRTPPYPKVSFNFNLKDPVSILLGGGILFIFVGIISAIFILALGVIFFILGMMLLVIGIIMWYDQNR